MRASERDVVAAQAVRVAAAVGPLVVQLDDRHVRREERHRPQDARAEHRMLLDDVVLAGGQRPRLAQHLVGDANLADVVQQRAEPERLRARPRVSCSARPIATDSTLTRSEWPAVYGSRASSAAASARMAPV